MDYIHQIDILKGGVPKLPVRSAYIYQKGLVGDKHKTKKYHGGLDSEVCLFLMDVIKKTSKRRTLDFTRFNKRKFNHSSS